AAPEVGAGGVGESAGGLVERERAVRGAADQHGLDRILVARNAVGVVRGGVVGQHVAADGGVFVGGGGVVGRHGSVVDLVDRQADGGYARVGPAAFPRRRSSDLAAPEVGAGGVGESAGGLVERERPVRGAADQRGLDRILVARN